MAGCVLDGFYVTQIRTTCTSDDFPSREAEGTQDTLDALEWIRQSDDGLYRIEKTYVECCSYNDAMVQGYWGVNSYNSTSDGDVIEFYRTFWPDAYVSDYAIQDFRLDANGYSLLSQLGVRYLLSKEPIEDSRFTLVNQFGSVFVYRNEGAVPPLFTREGLMGESDVELLSSATVRQVAIGRALVVPDEVASGHEPQAPASLTASLKIKGGDCLIGTVQASAPTVACLSIPYTPGWIVAIDGEEIETFRANIGFVGFEVPEGEHDIEVRYVIPGLATGLAISTAGMALTAVSCAVGLKYVRRRESEGEREG